MRFYRAQTKKGGPEIYECHQLKPSLSPPTITHHPRLVPKTDNRTWQSPVERCQLGFEPAWIISGCTEANCWSKLDFSRSGQPQGIPLVNDVLDSRRIYHSSGRWQQRAARRHTWIGLLRQNRPIWDNTQQIPWTGIHLKRQRWTRQEQRIKYPSFVPAGVMWFDGRWFSCQSGIARVIGMWTQSDSINRRCHV